MTLLTDEVRAWIGREIEYSAPEEIGCASIRYFAIAVGDENPLYIDDDYARAHGHPSVIAPPTFICETNQYMSGRPDDAGYLGHTWDLPVAGCRIIRGGNEYEFFRTVLPGDRITVRWKIEDITERLGSSGALMLLLRSSATYLNQDGEMLATNRETIVYQQVIV